MKKALKIKTTIVLKGFEKISESQEKKLLGGFSNTISGPGTGLDDGASNNCSGGNCVSGCGSGSNASCNTVAGCGK